MLSTQQNGKNQRTNSWPDRLPSDINAYGVCLTSPGVFTGTDFSASSRRLSLHGRSPSSRPALNIQQAGRDRQAQHRTELRGTSRPKKQWVSALPHHKPEGCTQPCCWGGLRSWDSQESSKEEERPSPHPPGG